MNQDSTINRSADFITSVTFVAILLGILILAAGIIFNITANINGQTFTLVNVINETGFANSSGYTVSGASALNFKEFSVTQLFNLTSGLAVGLGNISYSAAGLVTNATSTTWNNLSITYNYKYDTTNSTVVTSTINGIQNNILSSVGNFFALMPVLGTIFGIVILIAAIVILVFYVRRMKDGGSGSAERFQG